jgi:hypothetical protein
MERIYYTTEYVVVVVVSISPFLTVPEKGVGDHVKLHGAKNEQ